jgi:hypothetical protein
VTFDAIAEWVLIGLRLIKISLTFNKVFNEKNELNFSFNNWWQKTFIKTIISYRIVKLMITIIGLISVANIGQDIGILIFCTLSCIVLLASYINTSIFSRGDIGNSIYAKIENFAQIFIILSHLLLFSLGVCCLVYYLINSDFLKQLQTLD